MLFEVSLRRASAVLHRFASGIQRQCGSCRIPVEDVCDDGLENRVRPWSTGSRRCRSEIAESFDLESGIGFAEGRAGGRYRAAGFGGADAWRICETKKVR